MNKSTPQPEKDPSRCRQLFRLLKGVRRIATGPDTVQTAGGIEIKQQHNTDDTAALFSESTGRVLVSVGREDDVKFVGLCEARGIPVLRIGVTDASGEIEIQDVATFNLEEMRTAFKATLPALFG